MTTKYISSTVHNCPKCGCYMGSFPPEECRKKEYRHCPLCHEDYEVDPPVEKSVSPQINEAPASICEKCGGDKKNLCGMGKELNCIHRK